MLKIWTVAAFTETLFHGNLAGVCVVEEFPSYETALSIAAELKHSETAFLKQLGKDEFHIRWFTPKYEVDLCGHATLASAFLIWNQKLSESNEIKFTCASGKLKAHRQKNAITLDFAFEKTSELPSDFKFNWEKALGGATPINTAAAFGVFKEYLVELESADDVKNLVPNIAEIEKLPGNGLIVTARGNGNFSNYDFVSRVFAPQDGIPEDPVCASAHCKLAHYWEERLGKQSFKAFQPSARGGELLVERRGDRVFLTGHAIMVWEGNLHL